MEIFGIGPLELLLILAVLLIVVGPQRLPEMAAELARVLRTLQRYASNVRQEFGDTMKELEREYDDMKGEWKEIGQGLEETAKPVEESLKAAGEEASRALDDANAATKPSEPAAP